MAVTEGAASGSERAKCYRAIETYYELRGFRPKRQQRNALPNMQRFLDWCSEARVDPALFMRFRFEQIKPNPVSISSLRSPKSLEAFREWGEYESLHTEFENVLEAKAFTPDEDRIQALSFKPTRAQEALRASYQSEGRPDVCKTERRYTGGYDPRSKHCPRCPAKAECLAEQNAQHGFDVGALRIGMVQRLPEFVQLVLRKKR